MKAYSVGPDINALIVAICSRLTAKRRPFFSQCEMSLMARNGRAVWSLACPVLEV